MSRIVKRNLQTVTGYARMSFRLCKNKGWFSSNKVGIMATIEGKFPTNACNAILRNYLVATVDLLVLGV